MTTTAGDVYWQVACIVGINLKHCRVIAKSAELAIEQAVRFTEWEPSKCFACEIEFNEDGVMCIKKTGEKAL